MIELSGVSKSFGRDSLALWNVSLELEKGQLVFIEGPSASGKTVLLRLISGQLEPSDGEVLVDGINVSNLHNRRRRWLAKTIGIVPKKPLILKDASVLKTVQWAQSGIGIRGKQARIMAESLLQQVGLLHKNGTCASDLPEADQQRLSIARAIAAQPKVLLVDDPILALDKKAASGIIDVLDSASSRGIAVLMTTRKSAAARMLTTISDNNVDDAYGGAPPMTIRLLKGCIQH